MVKGHVSNSCDVVARHRSSACDVAARHMSIACDVINDATINMKDLCEVVNSPRSGPGDAVTSNR